MNAQEQIEAREDARGNTLASRTAAAVTGAASGGADRYHAWPADRSTEEVIAERMLMAALLNYRRAKQRGRLAEFKTHDQMSDIECGFYENAVRTAYDAIWGER